MKEAYFLKETIDLKAQEMLQEMRAFRRENILFSSDKSALIVLDMQNYFLEKSSHAYIPSTPAIIPNIQRLIRVYKNVIFTKHIDNGKHSAMQRWWQYKIYDNNPLSNITDMLDISSSDVITKTGYDAFFETSLYDMLLAKNVKQVVICGVMTHLCCDTTARSAFMHDFDVFLPIDATATYNEKFHMGSFINLSHGFATPLLTQDILSSCEGHQ